MISTAKRVIRFDPSKAVAFAAACMLAVGAGAFAQAPNKDREALKKSLKEKASALHREVLDGGNTQSLVSVEQGEQGIGSAPIPQDQAPAAPAPVGQGPRLVFDKNLLDFGVTMGDQPLVGKFPFRNLGTEKLIINAINTGCGCTAAKLAKMEFEPGEGDNIEITYNVKGSGKQQRAITIVSNDAQQPNMQVTIAAQVVPLVEVRPQTLQFGQVNIGERRTVQVVVVSRDPNVKVTSVESAGPEVIAELAPAGTKPEVMIEPELPGVAVINVTLKEDAPVGRVLRNLTIKALASKQEGLSQEEQTLTVNAFAAVKGEISVNPALLRVPPVVAGSDFSREAIVTRKDSKPFNILKAEISDSILAGLNVNVEPYAEGDLKGYKVRLSGNAGPTANNFRGIIKLTTDVPREENIDIQFSGIIRVPPPAAAGAPVAPAGATPAAPAPTGTAPPSKP